MGKSKEYSEGVRRRIVDLHKLKNCSFQDHQFKQLHISLIRYVTTLSCCGRRPKLSPPDEREWSRMLRNNLWPTRLKPAINWKLLRHQRYCPPWTEIFVVVMDKLNSFWRKVLWDKWDYERKMNYLATRVCLEEEPLSNLKYYICCWAWSWSNTLQSCYAAGGTGTCHKVIMKKEDDLLILQLNLKSAARRLTQLLDFGMNKTS